MSTRAERLAKLRRLAEHPNTPPTEAANARARLAEAEQRHGARPPVVNACGHWGARWKTAVDEARQRRAKGIWSPGDAGYYAWARSLRRSDSVRVRRSPAGLDGYPRDADVPTATIARVTPTQYVMADGRRFRRSGQHPGYMVGEDGRHGRHWIEPL